jgi:ethanolaminephosphotransferase
MTMTQPLPEWTYLLVAFGIFAFQTLDAIDGKQARRTGSSSPLGQLVDHGCDAISWTITNLAVISFLGLGISFKSVLSIYASIGPYFFTQLLEYYSGVYEYSIGILDSTTGQMILILFTALPAFFGKDFYFRS